MNTVTASLTRYQKQTLTVTLIPEKLQIQENYDFLFVKKEGIVNPLLQCKHLDFANKIYKILF